MVKIYQSIHGLYFATDILYKRNGESEQKRIAFTGGISAPKRNNGRYLTADEDLQLGIENDVSFGKEFRLKEAIPDREDKIKAAKLIIEAKARVRQIEEDAIQEDAKVLIASEKRDIKDFRGLTEEEKAKAIAEKEKAKAIAKKNESKVDNTPVFTKVAEAKDYLLKFKIPQYKLRSKADMVKAAAEIGKPIKFSE